MSDASPNARRMFVSVALGLLIGSGIAALLFSLSWLGAALDRHQAPNESYVWLAFMATCLGFVVWGWSRTTAQALKALLLRLMGLTLIVSLPATLWFELHNGELAPWIADRDFLTLVLVSLAAGVLALSIALSFRWDGRIAQLPVAALTLWFASEWAVKLGPPVSEWFDDPRVSLATISIGSVGLLCVATVLSAIDWHIKWRDRAECDTLARLEDEKTHG
ncbi:MAG: hypothetical protein KF779_05650 [Hyphomonadaceae bacterium]|nr:hypothetical protein [Hyphomonadaceae bacterium]